MAETYFGMDRVVIVYSSIQSEPNTIEMEIKERKKEEVSNSVIAGIEINSVGSEVKGAI